MDLKVVMIYGEISSDDMRSDSNAFGDRWEESTHPHLLHPEKSGEQTGFHIVFDPRLIEIVRRPLS
jgi:hypothetical protein